MQMICLEWATFWWLIHTYHTLAIHLLHCNYNFPVIWKVLHLVIVSALRKQSVQSQLQKLFFIKNSDGVQAAHRHWWGVNKLCAQAAECNCAYLNACVKHKPVWKRDLSTSGGIATAQLKIPAIPPANNMLGMLSSLWLHGKTDNSLREGFKTEKPGKEVKANANLFPGGVRRFFSHS